MSDPIASGEPRPCAHPAAALVPRFGARDYITGQQFQIATCMDCGLDVTEPRPSPAAMGAYYPPAYYGQPGATRFPLPVEQAQRLLYRERARVVEGLAGGRPGRVLDVGCGPGFLLDAFRRRRWEVQGTELSETSALRARALGLPVHVGELASWPWPEGHFDAAVLWHVLEHWADPVPVLRAVARVLRPGGVLMVGVPNFGSLEARLARDGWFHLDVPRHLVHFTPESLERVLGELRLEVRRRSFGALEFDLFSLIQSTLNRAGVRHNLLYNLLRRGGARVAEDAGWGVTIGTVLAAVPLGVVGLPLAAVLNSARVGSSMTVHAVKRA